MPPSLTGIESHRLPKARPIALQIEPFIGAQVKFALYSFVVGYPQITIALPMTADLPKQTTSCVSYRTETRRIGFLSFPVRVCNEYSTVKHCDRIFVLEGGVVAQAGHYDELIEQPGLFQDLVRGQQLRG